jgi:hypothetical protein
MWHSFSPHLQTEQNFHKNNSKIIKVKCLYLQIFITFVILNDEKLFGENYAYSII